MKEEGRDSGQQMTTKQTKKRKGKKRKRKRKRKQKYSHLPTELNNLLRPGSLREDQTRNMLSSMMEVEGSASARMVNSTSRVPVCSKSAPIALETTHYHVTVKTVTRPSKVKVSTKNLHFIPQKNKARQYTDLERRGHDEDNIKAGSQDEDNRSKAADSSHPASSDREESQAGRQPMEPEPSQSTLPPPKDSTQKISASTRRGLFAGRHRDASAMASLGGPCSPNAPLLIPQKEPPSPPPRPSSSLSPCSSLVSTFALRSLSPISSVVAQSCEFESSGLPGSLADTSSQRHTCLHSRDWPSTARLSMDEVGVTHVTALATRPRVAHNLLSHLPLHSQQPSRAPSLLIPIGGIHMIQSRSLLPLYSLVSSPRTATANPAETSRRLSDALKGGFSLLQHEDTLKETLHHSPASPLDLKSSRGMSKSSQSDALSHRKSQGCFGVQHTSNPGMETKRPEVNTETERHPETTQGQKRAPSSQTQI